MSQVALNRIKVIPLETPVVSEIIYYRGLATYYNYDLKGFHHSSSTPGLYSWYNATTASRIFPRGTVLEVTNIANGKRVVVRVNDYGPEEWTGKDLDLSSFAFSQISSLSRGVIDIVYRPL